MTDLPTHLPTDGRLGCHRLESVTNAADMGVRVFARVLVSNSKLTWEGLDFSLSSEWQFYWI